MFSTSAMHLLVIASLIIAPLFYGGNRPLPLLILELIAVAILLLVAAAPHCLRQLSKTWWILLVLLFLVPILQLLPLPFSWWQFLPAQQEYAQALHLAQAQAEPGLVRNARPLSLVPQETEYALLALLPPLAIFLACIGLNSRQLRGLVPVFLGMATFQALMAVAEYGVGRSANGTYVNRDHLAGFLEMALPVSLAMLVSSLGQVTMPTSRNRSFRNRLRSFIYKYCNRTALYGFIAISVLLGLIFTQSRSGVGLAMLIILLCAITFSRRLGGSNVYGMVGTYTAIGISLAVLIGLVPVLDRFVLSDHMQDARWIIYATMQQVIADTLPFGSGVGSFAEVFARYHPADITGVVVNRAHNDYLEWLMEAGIFAAILIVGFLSLYILRWRKVLQTQDWNTMHFIQIGAGIGLLAIILHGLVDFNLRIPANQIYFAFLAALFFHQVKEDQQPLQNTVPGHSNAPNAHNNAAAPTQAAQQLTPPLQQAHAAQVDALSDQAQTQQHPAKASLKTDMLGQEAQPQASPPDKPRAVKPGPNPFAE